MQIAGFTFALRTHDQNNQFFCLVNTFYYHRKLMMYSAAYNTDTNPLKNRQKYFVIKVL